MQVSVEASTGLERRLKVQVPEDRVKVEIDRRLSDMARTARIPGFRPGKVPVRILKQRYGRQLRDEVVGELLQSSFADALQKENLQPAGTPTIDPLEAAPGGGLSYTATFDVYPQLDPLPVETLAVTRPQATVQDADVERMVDNLRHQRRTWNAVERAATGADRVVIDFEGTLDDGPLPNGSGKDFELELGAKRMIPGFEDGLVGAIAGEERTLSLSFPEDYPQAAIAGKPVTFQVTVTRVEEPEVPALDDEFASTFGVSEGGVDDLLKEVRANMERELADAARAVTKQRVMDALLASQSVEVPRALIEQEVAQAVEMRRQEMVRAGMDPDSIPLDPAPLEAHARRRVSLGLLLADLIKTNEIKVDPERVRARIVGLASTYEDPDEVIRWYYSDQTRLSDIESSVLEDQAVEWILERAQVKDEPSTFDELLNPGQTTAAAGP